MIQQRLGGHRCWLHVLPEGIVIVQQCLKCPGQIDSLLRVRTLIQQFFIASILFCCSLFILLRIENQCPIRILLRWWFYHRGTVLLLLHNWHSLLLHRRKVLLQHCHIIKFVRVMPWAQHCRVITLPSRTMLMFLRLLRIRRPCLLVYRFFTALDRFWNEVPSEKLQLSLYDLLHQTVYGSSILELLSHGDSSQPNVFLTSFLICRDVCSICRIHHIFAIISTPNSSILVLTLFAIYDERPLKKIVPLTIFTLFYHQCTQFIELNKASTQVFREGEPVLYTVPRKFMIHQPFLEQWHALLTEIYGERSRL